MSWISIHDKLPDPYEPVFIFPRPESYGTIYVGECDSNANWKYWTEDSQYSFQSDCNVTHWMSIPSDPD